MLKIRINVLVFYYMILNPVHPKSYTVVGAAIKTYFLHYTHMLINSTQVFISAQICKVLLHTPHLHCIISYFLAIFVIFISVNDILVLSPISP